MRSAHPIGIFDSGYGGLTIMKEIITRLPGYDYLYLGDNARTPYGPRSFQTVYKYTLECVSWLFRQGCPLVILACNTASAKALRTIQQNDLPRIDPAKRVLGVIRPTSEVIGTYSTSGEVGILATSGTVLSESYLIEIQKFFPSLRVFQEACPMWVPLVENREFDQPGADYFVQKHLDHILSHSPAIDTLLLACTHYPLLKEKISRFLPVGVSLIAQGNIIAESLADYLRRHPEMADRCSANGELQYFTTDSAESFNQAASIFLGAPIKSRQTAL